MGFEVAQEPRTHEAQAGQPIARHVLTGVAAGVLLMAAYFGVITAIQGLEHPADQAARLWYWMALLTAGFGVQIGLFSFVRHSLKRRRAASASVAASSGVSTGSMVACCAHHLTDVLPALGLAGLSAFLTSYQVFFIVMGIAANVVGITIMLTTIQRHALCPVVARWKWNMARVRNGAIIASGPALAAAFVLQLFSG